jgi:alkyl sulfatase BDS1-like metallo-beta-lactamase superfamily hydrolase
MFKYLLISLMVLTTNLSYAGQEATDPTIAVNDALGRYLPFDNQEDFALAKKGLIAQEEKLQIKNADGQIVWDLTRYNFLKGERPETVNPSLWRQAQLNAIHGLFKVSERIYQVRGYDLSNMTIIEGDTGWIIVDPLTSIATAKAALALVNKTLGERPVKAVLSTHSHADHFGGIRGIISDEDLTSGRVRFIAPEHFVEEAVSENVIAGNVMMRRVQYMFGSILPVGPKGHVDNGLGKALSVGNISLMDPTDYVTETGQKMTIDGIDFEFQLTPGAEAPSEFMFYLPQFKALCVAEEVNGVMHNLYTLRGAKTRDALIWVRHLNDSLRLFGNRTDIVFGSHHWPRWGKEAGIEYIAKQRDMYRYIHDQTVRLMNQGFTPLEIAEQISLPDSLAKEFYNRDYYGTVSHNVRAVYNFYLGYFDGVPAHLNPTPPVQAGQKYIELAGGAEALIASAQKAYDAGDYQWASELLNHLVFADPQNKKAKELLANSYEQLGYQSESGPWRGFYLAGAQELREGVNKQRAGRGLNLDIAKGIPTGLFFDSMGARFNPEGADDIDKTINFEFTDTNEKFVLSLKNSVLNNRPNEVAADADLSLSLTRDLFNQVIIKETSFPAEILKGNITFSGNPVALYTIFSRLEDMDPNFNIVTP